MSLLMLLAAALMQVRRLGGLPLQDLVLGVISVNQLSPRKCVSHWSCLNAYLTVHALAVPCVFNMFSFFFHTEEWTDFSPNCRREAMIVSATSASV